MTDAVAIPYGLGRIPNEPDHRDYQLEAFLQPDPLDVALAALVADGRVAKRTKDWATFITEWLHENVQHTAPPAPPSPISKVWENTRQLDQGDTPHCGGFTGACWGNTLPVDDNYVNADGHKLYYECKAIDGEPGEENGTQVRSIAKALKARGRLNAYAFTTSTDTITQFVLTKGCVMVGTDWTYDMFNLDAKGFIHPTGDIAGGHAYVILGYDGDDDAYEIDSSWGRVWGNDGRAKIKVGEFASLLKAQGDACAAVELAL